MVHHYMEESKDEQTPENTFEPKISGSIEPIPEEEETISSPPKVTRQPAVETKPPCNCPFAAADPFLEHLPMLIIATAAVFMMGAAYNQFISNATLSCEA